MKQSEFQKALAQQFGSSYGQALFQDLILPECSGRTAQQALAEGVSVREVWIALCRETGAPSSSYYGMGREPSARD